MASKGDEGAVTVELVGSPIEHLPLDTQPTIMTRRNECSERMKEIIAAELAMDDEEASNAIQFESPIPEEEWQQMLQPLALNLESEEDVVSRIGQKKTVKTTGGIKRESVIQSMYLHRLK